MTIAKILPHIRRLKRLGACEEAITYAQQFKTGKAAWDACERGDWMLWLAGQYAGEPESAERKKLVLCACECARLAPPIKRADWERARLNCLDVTERWARSEKGVTIQDVRAARSATYAYVTYAAAAAAAAASACWIARRGPIAAVQAYAAAAAAAYAADAAARASILKQCAAIVRNHYPRVPRPTKAKVKV